MADNGSIAKAIHAFDMELQSRGEEGLTSVQKQMMIVSFAVTVKELGKSPDELVNIAISNYRGNPIEAARYNYSKGMGRVA